MKQLATNTYFHCWSVDLPDYAARMRAIAEATLLWLSCNHYELVEMRLM